MGFLIGFIADKLILRRLQGRGSLTGWQADQVFISSLDGMLLYWATLAGIYGGVVYAPFTQEQVHFWLRILLVPFILSITVFVMRLGVGFIDHSSQSKGDSVASLSLSRSLIKAIVILTGTLILLQSLGISITPVIAALGIGGLAVSLAMEETLSNMFSGLYIIFSKQVQPGDYVRMKIDERDHIQGYITDITWRCTKIRTVPRRMSPDSDLGIVTVPNSRMASDIVVMFYRAGKEQEVLVPIQIRNVAGYDLEYIEQVTREVAAAAMRSILGQEPVHMPLVRYQSLRPEAIELTVALYGDEWIDPHLMQHKTIKLLYQRYQEEGLLVIVGDLSEETVILDMMPPVSGHNTPNNPHA